jgi:GNAT superfamily N-acetyltransferase
MLTVAERRRFWQRVLHEPRPRESHWVTELDGRIVGMVHASPSHDEDALPGTGEIAAIHVEPGLHGLGIGGRVLAAAVADLRAAGFHRATLWCLSDNAVARRFYEAKGWRFDGTTKRSFMGDFDGLPILEEVRYEVDL